jgi:glycosyltransferase involved in cell wall biosynthesis
METLNPSRISIVVPSFNQGQFLGATLQSLLDQQDSNLEVLVVDGASTDGTIDVIHRFAEQLAWWISEADRGQSHALNKGFSCATGEWLGWLNSDDVLQPGALQLLRGYMGREPARQWWIGGGHFIDDEGVPTRPFQAPAGLQRPEQLSDWRAHWFAQPSAFFSRSLFDRAGGGLREDLHFAMDLELWLRFLAIAPPGIIDSGLCGYRIHNQAKTGMLGVDAEMEIVRVLQDALGPARAMDRVACIAADRLEFEQKWRKLQALVDPVARPLLKARSAWRALTGARTR